MEETKNKGLGKNILIGVLIFLLGLSLFYIGYDKFLKKDKIPEQEENNNSETNNKEEIEPIEKWFTDNEKLLNLINLDAFKNFDIESASIDDYIGFIKIYMTQQGKYENDKDIIGYLVSMPLDEIKEGLKKYFNISEEMLEKVIDGLDNYQTTENDKDKYLNLYKENNVYYLNFLGSEFDQSFQIIDYRDDYNTDTIQLHLWVYSSPMLANDFSGIYNENPVYALETITLNVENNEFKIQNIKYTEFDK